MAAPEVTDLLPISPTKSTADKRLSENALSHENRPLDDDSLNISPEQTHEYTAEDSTFEVPASHSPYSDATKYMHHLSVTPSQKDRRASRNSFGASLPIPGAKWKSHVPGSKQGGTSISSICSSLSPVQSSGNIISSQTQQSSARVVVAAKNMAFAFDIDGVLVRGNRLIPEAHRALQILNGDNSLSLKIPYIFLTNGGGKLETDHCTHLSQILNTDIPVSTDQLIQSHTPMQALKEYHSTVLIIGGEGDKCKSIAQSYGFSNVIVPHDIVAWDATILPFKKLTSAERAAANPQDFSKINIDAILVFSSSRDYGTDLQIIMDLLRSSNGRLGTIAADPAAERIPIYFSQGDLVFPTEHFQPRMSQGTFRIGLEAIYKSVTGVELERVVYGKPERATYTYADQVLASWMDTLYGEGAKLPENVYMIGDNPASDICGGNMHGWNTCLVRTGVFQGVEGENDENNPASFGVFEDVLEAVTAALHTELGMDFNFARNPPVDPAE